MSAKRRFVLFILMITCFITGAQAATVYGTVYAWSDFEIPLKNVILEVNSTPVQSKIATEGMYSFDLPQGSYVIKARYYRNNVLEYTAEEEIQIEREGNYTIDILLFPPTDSEYEYLGDINLTGDMDIKNENNLTNYGILILMLLFSVVATFYLFWKKKTKVSETTPKESEELLGKITETNNTGNTELPEDLHEIYELILKKGGRITQKDLRKEVKYGEAKVSLMIADLEDRGLIKKIKKGRANIIIVQVQK